MNSIPGINYAAEPLTNVWLQNGYEISDGPWGKAIRYINLAGLAAAILAAVINKAGRLSNTEIVYLRRKLDLSQAECADLVGVEEQTLSLWERGRYAIPISTDALLRRICIEELKRAFSKKTQFPSTVSLVRLASRVNEGKYVCRHEMERWTASFQPAQTTQPTTIAMPVANNVTWTANPQDFVANISQARARGALIEPITAFEAKQQASVLLAGQEDFLLEGREAKVIVSMKPFTKTSTVREDFFELVPPPGDYAVNPNMGAWFLTSNQGVLKEFIYDTD